MDTAAESVTPYLTIWIRPRATLRRILDRNPREAVIPLVLAASVTPVLASLISTPPAVFRAGAAARLMTPGGWRVFNVVMLFVAPVLGLVGLYVEGALLKWTGRLLGGTAKAVEVRAAIAWSLMPEIGGSGLNLLARLLGLMPPFPAGASPAHLRAAVHSLLPFAGVFLVLWVWGLVLHFKCIAEAHRFSSWRAIGAVLIVVIGFFACILIAVVVPIVVRRHI